MLHREAAIAGDYRQTRIETAAIILEKYWCSESPNENDDISIWWRCESSKKRQSKPMKAYCGRGAPSWRKVTLSSKRVWHKCAASWLISARVFAGSWPGAVSVSTERRDHQINNNIKCFFCDISRVTILEARPRRANNRHRNVRRK